MNTPYTQIGRHHYTPPHTTNRTQERAATRQWWAQQHQRITTRLGIKETE